MRGCSSRYTYNIDTHSYQVRRPEEIKVAVGGHNIQVNELSVRRPEIKRIVAHPDYIPDENNPKYNKSYDFALIELRRPLVYNKNIRPICVDDSVFPPGANCTVTGWGLTEGENFCNSNI